MRRTPALVLFVAAALGLLAGGDVSSVAQDKKAQKKKAEIVPPDDATKAQIAEKTEGLRKAVAALKTKNTHDDFLVDVEVFLKAAEWIVRHNEWLTNDAGKQTLRTLDIGLDRAKLVAAGKRPWRDTTGKWVARGYRSNVDGSVQPYAMLLPDGFGAPDATKQHRMDIVLHGRDGTLTEVKFLSGHEGKAGPKGNDTVQVEVYGRGNNAYRWAGETDVWEAAGAVLADAKRPVRVRRDPDVWREAIDPERVVLRGFSMGGAGTWHIGLHHPGQFAAIGPGAGFTSTHGYIANLPNELPDHVEKCLRIYDAVGYAENAFMVPVVAYSGEKDAQKKAADNIENALKGFKEPLKFTHLVAPGLEHQMPAEWQAKAETEYRKHADKAREEPKRVRFVTFTPKYGHCDWVAVEQLERMYERAVVDATRGEKEITVSTQNVRRFLLSGLIDWKPGTLKVDGIAVALPGGELGRVYLEKSDGLWKAYASAPLLLPAKPQKVGYMCGPIDDAFMSSFAVAGPLGKGWHEGTAASAVAQQQAFARLWDKYFRGTLPELPRNVTDRPGHDILFGDPASNPRIAAVLPLLPIKWTKDELVVNGVKYDAKTHLPVMIYPHPLSPTKYVVLNTGHTFTEADLKGTNALLYPRLGDWAVIKPTPTEKDPAAFEVAAAGLFDENWQFPKK